MPTRPGWYSAPRKPPRRPRKAPSSASAASRSRSKAGRHRPRQVSPGRPAPRSRARPPLRGHRRRPRGTPPPVTPQASAPAGRFRHVCPGHRWGTPNIWHTGHNAHSLTPSGVSYPRPGVASQPHLHRPRFPVGPGEVRHRASAGPSALPLGLALLRPSLPVQGPLPGRRPGEHPLPPQRVTRPAGPVRGCGPIPAPSGSTTSQGSTPGRSAPSRQ